MTHVIVKHVCSDGVYPRPGAGTDTAVTCVVSESTPVPRPSELLTPEGKGKNAEGGTDVMMMMMMMKMIMMKMMVMMMVMMVVVLLMMIVRI